MASSFNLRAIISAVDRLSPVLRAQARTLQAWRRQFDTAGKGAIPMAAGLGAALALPAKAFMESENAAIALKNTLMTKDGLAPGFEALNKIATELGNKLPGTTADFAHMATVMKANGLATDSMINGGLKAAAYLAVSTQGLGETYESAALGITKISNVFNVADKDFNELADTMQRVVNLGVGIEPFTSAMSKAGGAMKALRQTGLPAAKSIAPLVALLVRSGVDPSEAGTGLKKIFSVIGGTGKFKTIEGAVEKLQALYKLKPDKLINMFKKIYGEEHGGKAIIIAEPGKYQEIVKEMEKQATLAQRVAESLKSLTNLIDSASGTFTNAMAAFATVYAPEMKKTADALNELADGIGQWIIANGPTIKMALETAGAFVGLKLAFYGASAALGVLTALMRTNPLMLLVQGIAIAAPLIYENWDKITAYLKDTFKNAVQWISDTFKQTIDGFGLAIQTVKGFFDFSHFNEPMFQMPQTAPNNAGSTNPRNSLLQPNAPMRGSIDVNFVNAPAGMRVAPMSNVGPFELTPNVGYRSFATGMQ